MESKGILRKPRFLLKLVKKLLTKTERKFVCFKGPSVDCLRGWIWHADGTTNIQVMNGLLVL